MEAQQAKKIRQAVLANRGGLENATDEQIMIIWQHLPPDVQKQYLDSPVPAQPVQATQVQAVKERKGQNAVSA